MLAKVLFNFARKVYIQIQYQITNKTLIVKYGDFSLGHKSTQVSFCFCYLLNAKKGRTTFVSTLCVCVCVCVYIHV